MVWKQSWNFYPVLSIDDDTSSVVLLLVVGSSDATAFTIGRSSFHGAQILGADLCGQNLSSSPASTFLQTPLLYCGCYNDLVFRRKDGMTPT